MNSHKVQGDNFKIIFNLYLFFMTPILVYFAIKTFLFCFFLIYLMIYMIIAYPNNNLIILRVTIRREKYIFIHFTNVQIS